MYIEVFSDGIIFRETLMKDTTCFIVAIKTMGAIYLTPPEMSSIAENSPLFAHLVIEGPTLVIEGQRGPFWVTSGHFEILYHNAACLVCKHLSV